MRYRFNRAAEIELFEAAHFYASRQASLGLQFFDEVNKGLATIMEAPQRWPEIDAGIRRYRLARFPYGLFYRVILNEVEIVAVADLRRRPRYWQDRLI